MMRNALVWSGILAATTWNLSLCCALTGSIAWIRESGYRARVRQQIARSHNSRLASRLIPHSFQRRNLLYLHDSAIDRNNDVRSLSRNDDEATLLESNTSPIDPFASAMIEMGYSQPQREAIINQLITAGLWDSSAILSAASSLSDNGMATYSATLQTVTRDYFLGQPPNPTAVSTLLIQDFQLSPIVAHQTRAALSHLLLSTSTTSTRLDPASQTGVVSQRDNWIGHKSYQKGNAFTNSSNVSLEQRFKSAIVSQSAQKRRQDTVATSATGNAMEYGLPQDYAVHFITITAELQEFWEFMTIPNTDMQGEPCLRGATAKIYLRHAKLFLGWYWNVFLPYTTSVPLSEKQNGMTQKNLSLYLIFPSKDKCHASSILHFLVWLRTKRHIAVSYEANLLRGLTKLLKFRFRKESQSDSAEPNTSSGTDSVMLNFGDIPLIRELRQFHRDANRRQALAPRVSSEELKWLSWPNFLEVVQTSRVDLMVLISEYHAKKASHRPHNNQTDSNQEGAEGDRQSSLSRRQISAMNVMERHIAVAFQKYLILAIFANVPDRQRTIRELELGRSFVKNAAQNQWCIKHSPEDYKTGRTYGERPPLSLPVSLTADIDDFISCWRPLLLGSKRREDVDSTTTASNILFRQVRTGKALTSDSVYSTVSKTCFYYTGKRTNPHLLRDMIVTHVREASDTTEQQLEALALFMGHSSAVQRKSYDRRTLTKKVEPAIALMEQVNKRLGSK